MIDQAAKTLTLHQAAQVICRTAKPTADQLNRVRGDLENGLLKGRNDAKLGWTTTAALVAEYLARRQMHKERVKREATDGVPASTGSAGADDRFRGQEDLKPVYRDILKEYFLTVLMRRRMTDQSLAFRVSVLGGQFLFLVALIGGMVWGVSATMIPQPPEQRAVENYITHNFPESRIHEWGRTIPVSGGMSVSVKFKYKPPNGKGVETERTFFVVGQNVSEASDRDDG